MGSFIVFDKAYNVYRQFAQWTAQQVWFVTRMKSNAVFHVRKVILDNTKKKNAKGVLKEQYVSISYKQAEGTVQKLQLRRITFKADNGKVYYFITNNFKISASQVALIYRHRWMIELLFKQIKQNFPLNYFWGESENAIRIQIYCALIAQVLMVVIKKKSETKRSFTSIITVVRLHIMSYVELFAFLKDTYKAWRSSHSPPINNKMGIALSFAFN
jgi:IS4 transposase